MIINELILPEFVIYAIHRLFLNKTSLTYSSGNIIFLILLAFEVYYLVEKSSKRL